MACIPQPQSGLISSTWAGTLSPRLYLVSTVGAEDVKSVLLKTWGRAATHGVVPSMQAEGLGSRLPMMRVSSGWTQLACSVSQQVQEVREAEKGRRDRDGSCLSRRASQAAGCRLCWLCLALGSGFSR